MRVSDHVQLTIQGLAFWRDQPRFEEVADRSSDSPYIGGWTSHDGSLIVASREAGRTRVLVTVHPAMLHNDVVLGSMGSEQPAS